MRGAGITQESLFSLSISIRLFPKIIHCRNTGITARLAGDLLVVFGQVLRIVVFGINLRQRHLQLNGEPVVEKYSNQNGIGGKFFPSEMVRLIK